MVEASSIPLPLSDLTFVLWSDECREYQWNWSAPTEPKLGPILIHHADQKVPGSIDGLPVLGLPYTDSAAMALLRAVNMLVVPLLFRSEVCLDYLDLAFMLARGGRVTALGPVSSSGAASVGLNAVCEPGAALNRFTLVLIPDMGSSDRTLWEHVDDLAGCKADLSLIAAHFYKGDEVVVWVMAVEP